MQKVDFLTISGLVDHGLRDVTYATLDGQKRVKLYYSSGTSNVFSNNFPATWFPFLHVNGQKYIKVRDGDNRIKEQFRNDIWAFLISDQCNRQLLYKEVCDRYVSKMKDAEMSRLYLEELDPTSYRFEHLVYEIVTNFLDRFGSAEQLACSILLGSEFYSSIIGSAIADRVGATADLINRNCISAKEWAGDTPVHEKLIQET